MRAGLDNAILGYLNSDERKVDGARIAQLLAHGAHALAAEGDEAVREGEAFQREVRTPSLSDVNFIDSNLLCSTQSTFFCITLNKVS